MTDKAAHPGVKSLLARFENNQPSAASPPPRDLSPAGSDNLSKVRASFVAVEGGSQGSPVLGLRRISPHSESPLSPSRVKSFSSEDFDGSIKSNGSSAQPTNGFGTPQKVNATEKATIHDTTETKGKEKAEEVTSANKENQPTRKSPTIASGLATAKPTKTVSKKPSNVHVGKAVSANKPASQAPSSKTSTQSRTPTSAAKPDNEKPARVARASKPSTTTSGMNVPIKAPVHKPSRASLATTNKASNRQSRASTPAREVTRPARLPNSTTTASLTSAGKLSATGGATSTLSRKPSSLKGPSTGARQRAVTPTTSSLRKQESHPPPGQSPKDRPHSQASTASKPVDEGFLARMMRPTASSASKAHEKVEVKSPPRTKVTRAPRRVPSKLETRPAPPAKEKTVSKKPSKPEQLPTTEPTEHERGQKAEPVQEIAEQTKPEHSVEPSSQSPEPVVEEKSNEEATAEPPVESITESVLEPTDSQPNNESSDVTLATQPEGTSDEAVVEPETPPQVNDQVEPAESPVEPTPEIPDEKVLAPAAEIVEETTVPAGTNCADAPQTAEPTKFGIPAVSEEKKPDITSEAPLEQETKEDEVDIDLGKLTLNEKVVSK